MVDVIVALVVLSALGYAVYYLRKHNKPKTRTEKKAALAKGAARKKTTVNLRGTKEM